MREILKALKEEAARVLSRVTYIIGYGAGFDAMHVAPVFIREQGDIDKLVWNHFCIHNLTTYLPPQKHPPGWLFDPDEKIGVVVKGCDSRSLISLMQEGAINRDRLVIIGVPCQGMIDVNKLRQRVNEQLRRRIDTRKVNRLNLEGDTAEVLANLDEVLYDKCLVCEYPNPLNYDEFIGEKREGTAAGKTFEKVCQLEQMSLEETAAFWEGEFARCIRCNACRNVCPMCYCQNQCLLDSRTPNWTKERVDAQSNRWYHLVRAFHLAGRCTECGECARVCPMNIPINLLPMKMNRELFELFGWRSGVKEGEKPPLMDFKMEEEKIE